MIRPTLAAVLLLLSGGCSLFPSPAVEPQIFNPYPQLSKVAVAPFFNLSTAPNADGRQFAVCYYQQLQEIQGFEVVPVGVVENAMKEYGLQLNSAAEVRALAQLLKVDAIAVGAITDYDPYFPPRCAFMVEWYSANPYFQPIPAGYGLPWNTPDAEQIPPALLHEAEFAAARAALEAQTPPYQPIQLQPLPPQVPVVPPDAIHPPERLPGPSEVDAPSGQYRTLSDWHDVQLVPPPGDFAHKQPIPVGAPAAQGPLKVNNSPVMRHVATYSGSDPQVVKALKQYLAVRDREDFAGHEAFMKVSDDFIRFCCHLHLSEMLTARGGAGKTRVVWRWPKSR
jgi:hypothetical protein